MKIVEIFVLTGFCLIASFFLVFGFIYQKEASKIENDLNIFLPSKIKIFLKLWIILEVITIVVSILALILALIFNRT